jgi:signal transduction histidine kinase
MNLALIRRKIEGDAELEDRIDSMSDLIDRTVQTVREISAELRPRLLDDIGLAAALELYLEGFALTTGIKCSLNVTASKIPVNDDAQTALFRIAQEAITNVARHAQASRIDVSFGQKDDLLVLEIRDDGKGIREEDLKSLGILGMKERAHIFGGRVDIEAMSRGGTRVVASIPADPPAEIREGSLPASS